MLGPAGCFVREKIEKRERGGAGKRERVGLERTKSLA